jgi:hypothetical protein
MLVYAFKNAKVSIQRGDEVGKLMDEMIVRVTGGVYCHVEAWLSGPQNAAECYSARSPEGTSIKIIDLTDASLWTTVSVDTTPEEDRALYGYAVGSKDRPYNFPGLIGIGTDTPITMPWARFCSQECFKMGIELVASMKRFASVNPLHVAPSGLPDGGFGFYELLMNEQEV